jgi:AraC-like DNA-binding protein
MPGSALGRSTDLPPRVNFSASGAVLAGMESIDGRIVVLRPGEVAASAIVNRDMQPHKDNAELIAGHDLFIYVARGRGTYRANGHEGILRPDTLLAVPAGAFSCDLTDDREMYVLAVREPIVAPDDPRIFTPSVDRKLSGADARGVRDCMEAAAHRVTEGRFTNDDVREVKSSVASYVWKREPNGARATLQELFISIWSRLAEPLSLESLAHDVGYTANYLNDLSRTHTGRSLGNWIADMRMARARVALEHTDLPVADVGAASGYDDPAYFSRAFRRAHGVPPATWRIGTRPVDSRYADVTIPIDVLHEIEVARSLPARAYSFA